MSRLVYAVILASGKGERMNCGFPKQFIEIAGKTIVGRSIEAFEQNSGIDRIIVVSEPSHIQKITEIVENSGFKKVTKIVTGGATRFESSSHGVGEIAENDAKVLIHDAARPFVSQSIINDCIASLDSCDAVNTAIKATDTIIEAENGKMAATTDRSRMMQVQTPQGFRAKTIKTAHSLAEKEGFAGATDDCGIVFKYGLADIRIVEGERTNIKITYPEDIVVAEMFVEGVEKNGKKCL
ncbi:2-C-methyl-D-erythritol 4-phosphate cytidylyltransferase [bacterium]|nr:2-C-methyl-D-erythritol 4-phosphate cytidylyltransferase [bacterium]